MKSRSKAVWSQTTIGDLVEFFDYQRVPLSSQQRSTRQGLYPYYGASGVIDFIDDYIFDGRYLLVAEDGENLNSRKTPIAFFASGRFWVNNHAHIIRAHPDKALDQFIKDWFAQANISAYVTGAAQPKLSQENLRRIKIDLPPLSVQRKIASILSAYDYLIENNTRRIKILEEMARLIYREWFIEFRFPGHENVRIGSENIPAGWQKAAFTDVADVLSGGTPKTDIPEYWDGPIPFFTPKDVGDYSIAVDTEKHISEIGLTKCNSRLYPPMTIFITARGTVGKVVLAGQPMAMNQSCYALKERSGLGQLLLFQMLRNGVEQLRKSASGATFDAIVVDTFKRLHVVVPTVEVAELFNKLAQPIYELQLNSIKRNAILRQTRDLLLPKLISGELDVSDLDIEISEPEEIVEHFEASASPANGTAARNPQPAPRAGARASRPPRPAPLFDAPVQEKPRQKNSRAATSTPATELEPEEVMAVFRQSARGRTSIERRELLRSVARQLGLEFSTGDTEQMLRGHLKAAVRRKIIGADGDDVWLETPTMEHYEPEELIEALRSVMRKGKRYDRETVIRAVARHFGFTRLRDTVVAPIKSAINKAIRRGVLGYQREEIWREE